MMMSIKSINTIDERCTCLLVEKADVTESSSIPPSLLMPECNPCLCPRTTATAIGPGEREKSLVPWLSKDDGWSHWAQARFSIL